jgi:hypothetical protein
MNHEIYLADASIIRSVAGELISAGKSMVVKRGNEHDSRFTLQKGTRPRRVQARASHPIVRSELCRGQESSFMLHLVFQSTSQRQFLCNIRATTQQLQFAISCVGNTVLPMAPFSVQQLNINPEI